MGNKNYKNKIKYNILSFLFVLIIILSVMPDFSALAADAGTAAGGEGIKVGINTDGLEPPPDITAGAAILINIKTGDTVYEKNSQKSIFPASTVKIMTAVIVMENVANLESKTVISKYVIDNTNGNSLNPAMKEGEVFTIDNLLNAMLLNGANDAALALAEYVAGNVPDFVVKMNEKARELGCVNTVFTNPTGMHSDDMRTTVEDMSKIALYASKIQKIMDITSGAKYTIPPTNKDGAERPLLNKNHFVSKGYYTNYFYSYARGINFGYTDKAGYCLTTVAEQTGLSYLCIVMGSNSTPIPGSDTVILNCFSDAQSLFQWVFSIYSYKTVVNTIDQIATVEVRLAANRDTVTLVPENDISVLLPQNADINTEITKNREIFEDSLVAPIKKGDILGKLTVLYNGEVVGTTNLLSNADVDISSILYVLEQIKGIVSGVWFKASVIIFIVIFAVYITVTLLKKGRKQKKKFY